MKSNYWEILSIISKYSQWWDNQWWWHHLQVKWWHCPQVKLRWCQTSRWCTCSLVSLEWFNSKRWWHQNSNKWWFILTSLWWWTRVKYLTKSIVLRKSSSNNKLLKLFPKIFSATLRTATSLETNIVSISCVDKEDVVNEFVKNTQVGLHA